MASEAAARISDDELWDVLGWRPEQEQEADQGWSTWLAQTRAWVCSARIDQYGQPTPTDRQGYLCRLLGVLETVHTANNNTRGVREEILRPALTSGLVLSGAKVTTDARFDDTLAVAVHRGQVIVEEHDEWERGMRTGSGRRKYYRLSPAGKRLADDSAPVVEPVLENWFIVDALPGDARLQAFIEALTADECKTLVDALKAEFGFDANCLQARSESSLSTVELIRWRALWKEIKFHDNGFSGRSISNHAFDYANELRGLRAETEKRFWKEELEFWTRAAADTTPPANGQADAAPSAEPTADEPNAAPAAEPEALPQVPEAVKESDAPKADPPEAITALEARTPAIDPKSPAWATQEQVADLEDKGVRTLANYRSQGESVPDGTFGRDCDGRIWRKETRNARKVFYLRASLPRSPDGERL